MRYAHDRDWDRGAPYSGNGPCPGEDPGRCLFYIRLPELQADRDGNTYPESPQRASPDFGQLCLPGGCGPYHGAEVCDVRSAVPAGTGMESCWGDALPADDEQLGAAGGGGLAAAHL